MISIKLGMMMKSYVSEEDLEASPIEMLSKIQRDLRILKIMCTFILIIVLFDYLLDIDWLGSKTRIFIKQ